MQRTLPVIHPSVNFRLPDHMMQRSPSVPLYAMIMMTAAFVGSLFAIIHLLNRFFPDRCDLSKEEQAAFTRWLVEPPAAPKTPANPPRGNIIPAVPPIAANATRRLRYDLSDLIRTKDFYNTTVISLKTKQIENT